MTVKLSAAFRRGARRLTRPGAWCRKEYGTQAGPNCSIGAARHALNGASDGLCYLELRLAGLPSSYEYGEYWMHFNDDPDTTLDDVVTAMLFEAEFLEEEGL